MGVSGVSGTTSATAQLQVMGAPLDPLVARLLVSVEVDTNLYLPSQCRIVFRGKPADVIVPGGFQLAVRLTVEITAGDPPAPEPVFSGEITAVDLEHGPEGTLVVVRAADLSHRLLQGSATMAYPEMTASDIVGAMIAEAGVTPGVIEPTTSTYQWMTQPNITPWAFIQQLAMRENCVAYADSLGVFNFHPLPKPEEAPPPLLSSTEPPVSGTQLGLGINLVRLRASVTGAEQVPEVTVTGYNPAEAMPIVGVSPTAPSSAQPTDPAVLPAVVGGELEHKPFFDARVPVDSQGQAEKLAESIAADLAGAMAEMEGQCQGTASITAGTPVSIGLVGPPFDGQYICTAARHVLEPANGGYTTWFTVGGYRDRSLLSLSGGPANDAANQGRVPGLVVGMVSDNMDPDNLGRVKVTFPWLTETYVSAWARTMQIGAGTGGVAGFLWVPEVGDEVLVGFDRGDIDHPYVIGGLYNGLAKPEPAPSINAGVTSRRITSREMHTIQFDDGPEATGITIKVGTETVTIKLDAEQEALTITSAGKITLQAGEEGMSFESAGSIQFQAAESFQVSSGQGVTVEAGGDISMESGSGVSVESSTISLSAPSVMLGG